MIHTAVTTETHSYELTFAERVRGRVASALPGNLAVRLDDRPICSFTFDDCPTSALTNAGGMLESAGVAGTFFISAGLAKQDSAADDPLMRGDDIVRACSAGHEIGCHTYDHAHLPQVTRAEVQRTLDENVREIRQVLPDAELSSFAYPYGEVSVASKAIVARRFAIGRGLRPGLNGRLIDMTELRAYGIRSASFAEYDVLHLVRNAAKRHAWLVFVTHDVREEASEWGCTPSQFAFVLDAVRAAGIEILPLRAAVGRVTHRTPRD